VTDDQSTAVTVAYVHANDCTMSWHHSIIEMLAHDMGNAGRVMRGGWVAIHSGTDGLVQSRNMAVKNFLEDKRADWLFWTDTDMGFAPDTIDRLLEAADPVERPIVGALCFCLQEVEPDQMGGYVTRLAPTIYDWTTSGEQKGYAVRWQFSENALTRCAGTGSACILIHRSAFETVKKAHGAVWYDRIPNTSTGQLIGEDLSFCLRAGALNIPIYVHTGVKATHAKTNWFSDRHYQEQLQTDAIILSRQSAGEPTAVIVPVLGRPQNAEPFMKSLKASTSQAQAYAVVGPEATPEAFRASVDAWTAAGARVLVAEGRSFAQKVNHAYRQTTEPWLLLVGDDVAFHPGWLEKAQRAGGQTLVAGTTVLEQGLRQVIGTNDLGNPRVITGQHTCHPLIRRSYVDNWGASWDGPGVVCHEGYGHNFVDDELVAVAKQRGCWASAPDAIVEHLHPFWGKGKPDHTYELGQVTFNLDKKLFEKRFRFYTSEVVPTEQELSEEALLQEIASA
jgi:hypothetical protein